MFYLCGVEDKVRVDPDDLGRPAMEAVTSVIEQLYIDKARLLICSDEPMTAR
jgi:DNA-directed RNA polymerase subunit E'/Rpb7